MRLLHVDAALNTLTSSNRVAADDAHAERTLERFGELTDDDEFLSLCEGDPDLEAKLAALMDRAEAYVQQQKETLESEEVLSNAASSEAN